MSSFAEDWYASVTGPINANIFDPQGTNFNPTGYGVTPQFQPTAGSVVSPNQPAYGVQPTTVKAPFPASVGADLFGQPGVNPSAGSGVGSDQSTTSKILCNTIGAIPLLGSSLAPGCPATDAGGDNWQSYFNRGVVIILGFIFVAAGLYMFKSGVTVEGALRK